MKRSILFILGMLPILAACNTNINKSNEISSDVINSSEIIDNSSEAINNKHQNVKTTDYKAIKADEIHQEIEEGYVSIPYARIGNFVYEAFDEEINYLYKLSCKNETDSFKNHLFEAANDGCYYVQLSEKQNKLVQNGFDILRNSNVKGSSAEINIDEIYKCYSYREIFYSESEKILKVIYYDDVIPGLEEAKVNLLIGVPVDESPYVEENKVKSGVDGGFPFTTGLEIEYIDVSDVTVDFGK